MTEKTRKIPLRKEVAAFVNKLLETAPSGFGKPLFRNTRGNPWKRMTGVVRFIDLKEKLGWDLDPVRRKYSSLSCRHTFAHRMLSGNWNNGVGCSIETLVELLGDTPAVAYQHYGKEWALSYQEPLWAAIAISLLDPSGNARPRKLVDPDDEEIGNAVPPPSRFGLVLEADRYVVLARHCD
ncbi:MAG: hypothetical protein QM775_24520 [Pirellulales bacterium]